MKSRTDFQNEKAPIFNLFRNEFRLNVQYSFMYICSYNLDYQIMVLETPKLQILLERQNVLQIPTLLTYCISKQKLRALRMDHPCCSKMMLKSVKTLPKI